MVIHVSLIFSLFSRRGGRGGRGGRGRGRGGRGGGWSDKSTPTKEELDKQLDLYNSKVSAKVDALQKTDFCLSNQTKIYQISIK